MRNIMVSMKLSKVSNALMLASLLAVGAAVLSSAPAHAAGSAPANLAVTAAVNANCTISTTAVAFGAYDPVVVNAATALNASGSVSIACTKGSAPAITMDLGQHAVATQRNMLGSGADVLGYQLYQPPNTAPGTACTFPGGTVWGTSVAQTFTPTSPANKTSRSYNVCGTVAAGQDVGVGLYADVVVATVNF
jgi:spore coat protein U-like protein